MFYRGFEYIDCVGINLDSTHCWLYFIVETIQVFDISNNPLNEIPIEVGNLQLLKETQQWEVGIGMLKNLVNLSSDSIKLLKWPPQLENCVLLKSLVLSNNFLTEIPPSIGAHTALAMFDGQNNHITSVPVELFALPIKVSHFCCICHV